MRKQELHILFKINGVWLLKSCRCILGHGRERQCEDWASEATRQNSSYFAKMCLLGRLGRVKRVQSSQISIFSIPSSTSLHPRSPYHYHLTPPGRKGPLVRSSSSNFRLLLRQCRQTRKTKTNPVRIKGFAIHSGSHHATIE